MDEELDVVSSGRWRTLRRPVAAPGRSGWIAILVLAGVLACLGLITNLALQVAHQNDTINKLHAAAKNALSAGACDRRAADHRGHCRLHASKQRNLLIEIAGQEQGANRVLAQVLRCLQAARTADVRG